MSPKTLPEFFPSSKAIMKYFNNLIKKYCVYYIIPKNKFVNGSQRIDPFLNSDSFYNCTPNLSSESSSNYYNINLLNLDVKQLNKIIKPYYFYTLKAL